jgi:hypothetical protein
LPEKVPFLRTKWHEQRFIAVTYALTLAPSSRAVTGTMFLLDFALEMDQTPILHLE